MDEGNPRQTLPVAPAVVHQVTPPRYLYGLFSVVFYIEYVGGVNLLKVFTVVVGF